MNDDWDGVDWAMHFSGPDDNEIEYAQESAYQADCANDHDDTAYDSSDAPDENVTAEIASRQEVAYEFKFDCVADVNIFTGYMRGLGELNISVFKNELITGDFSSTTTSKDLFTVTVISSAKLCVDTYRTCLPFRSTESLRLLEMYYRSHTLPYICHQLKRTEDSVFSKLKSAGEVFDFPKFSNVTLDEPATLSVGLITKSDASILFEARVFEVLQDFKTETMISLKSWNLTDRLNLYAALLQGHDWSIASDAGGALNEQELVFKIARQFFVPPKKCYEIVRDVDGLSPSTLYQRELIRAMIGANCLDQVGTVFSDWLDGAKLRVNNWQYRGRLLPPRSDYPYTKKQLATLQPDLRALINSSNETILEALAKSGNRMAACLLADYHRRRAWVTLDDPHDAPDFAASIQGDYWPSVDYVQELLIDWLAFDPVYASWMQAAKQAGDNYEKNVVQ